VGVVVATSGWMRRTPNLSEQVPYEFQDADVEIDAVATIRSDRVRPFPAYMSAL